MSARHVCFVVGTDTGIGKTLVAAALLHRFRDGGFRAVGMKPVAAGCDEVAPGVWRNADVEALLDASSLPAGDDPDDWRARINPCLFREPLAPHIAAAREGAHIDLPRLVAAFHRLRDGDNFDAVVVEGAGGLRVPLNGTEDGGDLAVALGLPLVLVVGMRLGCLNQALLTQESIAARGLALAGWVANRIDPAMACFEENLSTLRQRIAAPLLGVVPHMATPDPRRVADVLALPA